MTTPSVFRYMPSVAFLLLVLIPKCNNTSPAHRTGGISKGCGRWRAERENCRIKGYVAGKHRVHSSCRQRVPRHIPLAPDSWRHPRPRRRHRPFYEELKSRRVECTSAISAGGYSLSPEVLQAVIAAKRAAKAYGIMLCLLIKLLTAAPPTSAFLSQNDDMPPWYMAGRSRYCS